ncbi:MAG TPA: hypothetical protein VFU15_14015 [Bacteroidia bacterium]|nr:hypothetical protein [Bacteroidia bacterium]
MKTTFACLTLTAGLFFFAGTMKAQQDTTKKAEFKPSGKVWGYAFGDYYFKTHADSANRGNSQYSNMPVNANSFELRRVYLGYDYNISERFSSEFLLSYEGQTGSDGSRTTFVKAANLRWKNLYKGADLIFGLQATPAFPMMSEKIWGYRSDEKTILDMRKLSGSADLGIGLQGKCGSDGQFGYDFLVANGSGTKLEGDIFKKFYGDVYAKFMDKKLIVDLYGDFERTNMTPDFHKYRNTGKLTLAWNTDALTIGAEAFLQIQHNYVGFVDTSMSPVHTDTTDAKAMGVSIFVRGTIIKDKLAFFARYDMYNPDLGYKKDYIYTMGGAPVTESFATAGIDFTPAKNVHIMPNVWFNSYMSRAKGASGKVKSDYDFVPRLTFWYIFK